MIVRMSIPCLLVTQVINLNHYHFGRRTLFLLMSTTIIKDSTTTLHMGSRVIIGIIYYHGKEYHCIMKAGAVLLIADTALVYSLWFLLLEETHLLSNGYYIVVSLEYIIPEEKYIAIVTRSCYLDCLYGCWSYLPIIPLYWAHAPVMNISFVHRQNYSISVYDWSSYPASTVVIYLTISRVLLTAQ